MIRFEGVSMEYERTMALEDVSFELDKGEFCFLTGHSGAGKSTILRLIHMAERPTAGELRVSGYSGNSTGRKEIALLRRKIGYVFQNFRLLQTRSALDNVAFALQVTGSSRTAARTRASQLLTQVGLASKAGALPTQLSGGEQQRVAVARALANQPIVLLADEPTGNLDERATRGIVDLFRDINTSGTAVLFATHDLELIRSAGDVRLLELDHGRLVYDSGRKD